MRCPCSSAPADAATAHRLVGLIEKDKEVAARMKQFARPYLCELARRSLALNEIKIDLRVRSKAATLLIDGDAMVSLGDPAPAPDLGTKGRTRG